MNHLIVNLIGAMRSAKHSTKANSSDSSTQENKQRATAIVVQLDQLETQEMP
jgi:hypothetical protein